MSYRRKINLKWFKLASMIRGDKRDYQAMLKILRLRRDAVRRASLLKHTMLRRRLWSGDTLRLGGSRTSVLLSDLTPATLTSRLRAGG